jgi:hypothetical protein
VWCAENSYHYVGSRPAKLDASPQSDFLSFTRKQTAFTARFSGIKEPIMSSFRLEAVRFQLGRECAVSISASKPLPDDMLRYTELQQTVYEQL